MAYFSYNTPHFEHKYAKLFLKPALRFYGICIALYDVINPFVMLYKFPNPVNLLNGFLASFTGYFNALYVPKTDKEKYCYASLTKKQVNPFLSHFGVNGGCILDINSNEYPGSHVNKLTNRIDNFILLIKRFRATLVNKAQLV